MPSNWKTTANGILALVIGTAGPLAAYLATQNSPKSASAAGIVTLVAAIARVCVGILENDAPPAPVNTSSTIPPAAKLLLCALALGSFGLMGCKGPTATAPLAPGYVTAGEQSVGEVIAAASAAVVKYEALKGAPGFVDVPGADATITAIQQTLVIADPLAVAWHNTLLTNSAAAEPAALVTAINALNNGLAALPGGVK